MADGGVSIDKATFQKRLKQLYDHWKGPNSALWNGATAVLVSMGTTSEDLRYLKSLALHLWLLGYELPDTVLAFTPTQLHVLTSQKKVDVLQPVVSTAAEVGVEMVFHVKAKTEDGSSQMQSILEVIRASAGKKEDGENGVKEENGDHKVVLVGTLPKDQHTGKFYDMVQAAINAPDAGIQQVDVTAAFADLLSVKDSTEVINHKKAAMLASRVLKDFVIGKIESIVDDGKSTKHSKLAEMTEEAITNPAKVNVKLKAENCDIAYPPLFQSGGKYDFRMSALSDDSPLHDGVIVCSVGARYSFYCANIGRTIFINPTKKQEAEYGALLAAQEAVIGALKDGAPTSAAADAAIKALKDSGQPDLVERLSRSLGHGMGLELRETGSSLSTKNTDSSRQVRAGQVYNVTLSFTGLENPDAKDAKGKTYAMLIADTVVVPEGAKPAEVATSMCPKTWDKVSYIMNDDDNDSMKLEDVTNGPAVGRAKALRSENPNFKNAEALRKERQEDLVKQKNQETLERLTMGRNGSAGAGPAALGRKISEVVSYRNLTDIPMIARDSMLITVDPKNETILLPVYGVMVPFHITTVKNVTHAQDG